LEKEVFHFHDFLTIGGLQQFILDMKFFLEAAGSLATENTCNVVDDLIDRAILIHCKAEGKTEIEDLKSDEWIQIRIKKALK
jgi:hypothetical protein